MKKIILLLITFLYIFSPVALAQSGEIKRCTEQQLPLENRKDYMEQATEFLRSYYNQLMLNVNELVIQKEFIKKNMYSESMRYKPEFMLEGGQDVNYLHPNQYLLELEKQYHDYDTDNVEITIDNVNINQNDFFIPSLVSCYLIAEYDLTFVNEGETLFKRRCRAYCLFPNAMAYINVKLMQVESVKDIIPYKPQLNELFPAEDGMDETNKALWQKAQNSDATAQFKLGKNYYDGKGIKQDYEKAVKWYTKAAEQGLADAQEELGDCYKFGEGVRKNKKKAIYWYTKAAEQGHAKIQFSLAYDYECDKNYEEALKWCTKAAEQGHADTQNIVGKYYEYGKGVEQNFEEAVKWYTKAAEQGFEYAQYNLARCYDTGKGVDKNPEEAVKWYTKAAEQRHDEAQYSLGVCYETGYGVNEDLQKAIYWYTESAKNGNEDSVYCLKRLGVNIPNK